MSQKRKLQRAHHAEKEAEQGKKAVMWVFAVLVVLAVCFMVYSMFLV